MTASGAHMARGRHLIDAFARDRSHPTYALMRLVFACGDAAELEAVLDEAGATLERRPPSERERVAMLLEVAASVPGAYEVMHAAHAGSLPSEPVDDEATYWSQQYDLAVRVSPEASVALYSLGDPTLLRQATDELVSLMHRWDLLSPTTDALDFGCGIGRVTAAIAPLVSRVDAVDISAGMVTEAQRRLVHASNVRVWMSDDFQRDPSTGRYGLILMIDVLPHLTDPSELLAASRSWLAPGGQLLIMNWSYELDLDACRAAAEQFARGAGLEMLHCAEDVLETWDGFAYLFRLPPSGADR